MLHLVYSLVDTNYTHIFNGDSTADTFAHSGLEGLEFVWREMVVQGPCKGIPGQESFFGPRREFFREQLGTPSESYYQLTEQEWHRLEGAPRHDEWVLWYEYNVFCQLNLVAILAGINAWEIPPGHLSLICVGQEKGKWHTLADYSPDQYGILLEQRQQLSKSDIQYASSVWDAITVGNPKRLSPYFDTTHPAFPYLGNAIRCHLQQFPNADNGMNRMEMTLLEAIATSRFSQHELLREILLNKNHPYGFGNLQWMWMLKQLQPLWQMQNDKLTLTGLGKKVLEKKASFRDHLSGRWIGGALAERYVWREDLDQIEVF